MLAIEDDFLNHYRLFSWLHCQTDICAFHLRNGWPWLPFSWATGRGKIWCFGPPSEHRFKTCFFCGMCFFHVSHCEINCNLGCGCVPTVEATCSFMLRGFGGLRNSKAKLPTNHSWACLVFALIALRSTKWQELLDIAQCFQYSEVRFHEIRWFVKSLVCFKLN